VRKTERKSDVVGALSMPQIRCPRPATPSQNHPMPGFVACAAQMTQDKRETVNVSRRTVADLSMVV
jgi:hypothetical protein